MTAMKVLWISSPAVPSVLSVLLLLAAGSANAAKLQVATNGTDDTLCGTSAASGPGADPADGFCPFLPQIGLVVDPPAAKEIKVKAPR
jgi:hypothetical protein